MKFHEFSSNLRNSSLIDHCGLVDFDPFIWRALDYKVFKTFFILAILSQRNRDPREILAKLNMSYESLVRMVEYSQKMIEKISKEVEDNFIERKELWKI